MSDIFGQGYGYKHDWMRGETARVGSLDFLKNTQYSCRKCFVVFAHYYDNELDIFEVIRVAGVSEECQIQESKAV